jgi:hypothetical protein
VTEITAVRGGPLARARRRLSLPAAPPSPRALLVLLVSAFLLGGVLSALLFVGVWRHTAADADRARADQLAAGQTLQATRFRLARAEADLAAAQVAIAKVRAERNRVAGELARLRHVSSRAGTALPPRLQAIASEAGAVSRESAKLASALATLNTYLGNASAGGVDPAFLAIQVRYLSGATSAIRDAAATLTTDAQRAQASAAPLRRKP